MPDDPRGRNRRRTAPCVFCARCLKWQRPLTLHLKGWPLIQPTNWLAHTQLSGDNHLTNVWPAPPHMEGASDCSSRRPHVIDNRAHFTLLAHQETRRGRWRHRLCLLVFLSLHIGRRVLLWDNGECALGRAVLHLVLVSLQSPIINDSLWTCALAGGESSSAMHQRLSTALY